MNRLQVYRDDGALARGLARLVGRSLPLGEVPLLALGATPLLVVLVLPLSALSADVVALAVLVLILLGGAAGARAGVGRLTWIVSALLRALEYGTLVKLTALTDPGSMPACYALLALLAFHHYDTVYSMRHQREAPPAWVALVAGGWDGRLAVAAILALADVLGDGMIVAIVVLAPVLLAESAVSWVRYLAGAPAGAHAAQYGDEDVEDA